MSIDVLFSASAGAETFGAGCALATSLDEAAWTLFSIAVTPQVLSSTSRYIAAPPTAATITAPESAFDEIVALPATNSFILLSQLASSGRLYETIQAGTAPVKAWEKTIGAACEQKIREWVTSFDASTSTEGQVSSFLLVSYHSSGILIPVGHR